MSGCEEGTCPVHTTFEKALLAAVEGGTKRVESVLETAFRDLNRRLDESLADRTRLHQRLDEYAGRVSALEANVDSMIAAGHPLRRADDPAPRVEASDERVPSMPRWAAVAVMGSFSLAGVAVLLIWLLVKDPTMRNALVKMFGGG